MWRRNGLSIVLFLLLACFLVGQVWTGFLSHNRNCTRPTAPAWTCGPTCTAAIS